MIQFFVYEPNIVFQRMLVYIFISNNYVMSFINPKRNILTVNKDNNHANEQLQIPNIDDNSNKKHNIFIVKIDSKDKETFEIIKTLNNDKDSFFTKVIFLVDNTDVNFLKYLKKFHHDGIIFKSKNIDHLTKQIQLQLKHNKIPIKNDRKLLYIQPSSEDMMRVNIRSERAYHIIIGHVINLSLNSLIFNVKDEKNLRYFKERLVINEFNLVYKTLKLELTGMITAKKNSFVAMSIRTLSNNNYALYNLSMYIHESLQTKYKSTFSSTDQYV